MSTKMTLRHGETWHLYNDGFDDEHVYLNIENIDMDVHVEGDQKSVCIRISDDVAKEIGLIKEEERFKINWDKIPERLKKLKEVWKDKLRVL